MAGLNVLIMGASYGSLLGMKMALGGHHVALVCLPNEVERFNAHGAIVRMPIKGHDGLVELSSKSAPGSMKALGPAEADVSRYDLVCLAMQEPQYRGPGVRELLDRVAKSGKPCMSIMNMPPLPYLARIPGIDAVACRVAFTDPTVWDSFDPKTMTLCSPDPQAFRPADEPVNVLQVRLPTNFKAARFDDPKHTAVIQRLADDIDAVRWTLGGKPVELPVKLKVHNSVYVPLAKWAMLLAGNYRCVEADTVRAIKDAVHSNVAETRSVYNWVADLCVSLGADPGDMVPFEKYAAAAQSLGSPSSAARALAAGAVNIERVDKLVQTIAAARGLRNASVDATVALVDQWLTRNRAKAS